MKNFFSRIFTRNDNEVAVRMRNPNYSETDAPQGLYDMVVQAMYSRSAYAMRHLEGTGEMLSSWEYPIERVINDGAFSGQQVRNLSATLGIVKTDTARKFTQVIAMQIITNNGELLEERQKTPPGMYAGNVTVGVPSWK